MKEKITKRKLGEMRKDRTDWASLDSMTEKVLERAIAADPDADVPNLDWTKVRLVLPRQKQSIHLRVDPDVLTWFRRQGRGYLTRMNLVLKAYYEVQRNTSVRR